MKIRYWLIVITLLLALTACTSDAGSDVETAPVESNTVTEETTSAYSNTAESSEVLEPTATSKPTAEPETAAEAVVEEATPIAMIQPTSAPETAVLQPLIEDVTIAAADGLPLHATYYGPGGMGPFPGVLLLHMLGSNRQVWDEVGLADTLVTNGYAVLALDMRGHGDSGSSRDWDQADDDLQRVWAYFVGRDEVDGERTAVIGASIGSNMALRTGANEPAIKTVALLSPGLEYRGVTTDDAIVQYGTRPILIVASEEDSYAAESSKTLAEVAAGEVELIMYDGAGHGTNMFAPQPDLTDSLINWLKTHL